MTQDWLEAARERVRVFAQYDRAFDERAEQGEAGVMIDARERL